MKHTVYVLAATAGHHPPADHPSATGTRPRPDEVLTYVGRSNLPHVEDLANRFRKAGYTTDIESVTIEVNRANPCEIATALAMLRVGDKYPRDYRVPLEPVDLDTARQVSPDVAAKYLDAMHELTLDGVPPGDDLAPPADPLALAALRLARRATAGDLFARLALAELAAERHAVEDQDVPADVDPLTLRNSGRWDR